jgi:hypothetical protein
VEERHNPQLIQALRAKHKVIFPATLEIAFYRVAFDDTSFHDATVTECLLSVMMI